MTAEEYAATGLPAFVGIAQEPAFPAAAAGAAEPTHAAIAAFEHQHKKFLSQKRIFTAFKTDVIGAMEDGLVAELMEAHNGEPLEMINLTEIMTFLRTRLGRFTHEDIRQLLESMQTVYDPSNTTLDDYLLIYHQTPYRTLTAAQRRPYDDERVHYLAVALAPCTLYDNTIANYYVSHPHMGDITWDSFIVQIRATRIPAPAITVSQAGYGTTAAASGHTAPITTVPMEDPNMYCWKHGLCFHKSTACRFKSTIPVACLNKATFDHPMGGSITVAAPRPAWMSNRREDSRRGPGGGGRVPAK